MKSSSTGSVLFVSSSGCASTLASVPSLVVTMYTSIYLSTGSMYAPDTVVSAVSSGSTPRVWLTVPWGMAMTDTISPGNSRPDTPEARDGRMMEITVYNARSILSLKNNLNATAKEKRDVEY